jgi:hypothetical protein
VSVPARGNQTGKTTDLLVNELLGSLAAVILKMLLSPFMAYTPAQLRTGPP